MFIFKDSQRWFQNTALILLLHDNDYNSDDTSHGTICTNHVSYAPEVTMTRLTILPVSMKNCEVRKHQHQ
jgi:hypothetical protein